MKYVVVTKFHDLQDNKFEYNVGDVFPRAGFDVDKKRITELSTKKNRRGIILIEKLEIPFEDERPKKKK